jgi:hypothetical protein
MSYLPPAILNMHFRRFRLSCQGKYAKPPIGAPKTQKSPLSRSQAGDAQLLAAPNFVIDLHGKPDDA